jgi:hypothetical protein
LGQFQNLEKQKYHIVGTVPKSRKTKITTLSRQFQNLEKQKYHTVGTVPKSRKTKYYTVGTVPKYRKTKIPHCRDSSKI